MNIDVSILYRKRFEKELNTRKKIWKILCEDYFQKYISPREIVCDLGAGYCEFINNIRAKSKIAVDINKETKQYANKDVTTYICSSIDLPDNLSETIDTIFASNFFEHLPTKDALIQTLIEIKRVLKPNGKLMVLTPNIKYVGPSYWDFLDHQIPLTDDSIVEALELNDFEILLKKSKFLPYSTRSKLPKAQFLIKTYLKLPFLHTIFGKQSFVIAKKKA